MGGDKGVSSEGGSSTKNRLTTRLGNPVTAGGFTHEGSHGTSHGNRLLHHDRRDFLEPATPGSRLEPLFKLGSKLRVRHRLCPVHRFHQEEAEGLIGEI